MADIGCGRQPDWATAKNFLVNLALTCDEQMLKISRRYLDSYLSNGWLTEKLLQQMAQDWSLFAILPKSDQSWAICYNKFSVKGQLLRHQSRYLLEIFSICSSHVNAKLTKKILPLLNQPASNSQFGPKFWMALATIFVRIFFGKNFWWGSRPILVTHWKEFWISWKKWPFTIFRTSCASRW